MAGEKQLEQRLRSKLLRDKATYQTQLSRRETALRISTDPKESAARRAEAKSDYERLVKEIKDLKNSMDATERNINKEKARKSLEGFDPEKGKQQADALKEKYTLLEQAYKIDKDPAIKKQMDDLVAKYRDIYSSVIGTPISSIAAKSALVGAAPTFETKSKQGETVTPPVTSTGPIAGSPVANGQAALQGTTNRVPAAPAKPITAASAGAKPFTQPITIAGQVSNVPTESATDTTGTPLDTLLAKTEFWYDLPDYIFKVDKKIGDILIEAVNNDWAKEKFMAKVQLTPWWQKNAGSIREKIIQREKYNDLKKAGEDVSKTEYGIYLGKQMRAVKAKAQELANVTLTDEQAQSIAQKIYDGNLEDDPLAINSLIIPFISKTPSIAGKGLGTTSFGGQALKDYQTLQSIAKANGFTLKDILPNVSALTAGGDLETAVLRGLAEGTIDINRIAQDARMLAAQGQPEYVRGLLGQGYDLQDIYAPYRNLMATELEINADQIDLNDPTLRMAITDKGDMNIYDFKKALRKDNRWQYTASANEEVSNSVLGVLKNFGFQG